MKESALLLLFAARHYGYYHWPVSMWGDVFALFGSLALIVCLLMLGVWWPLTAWIVGEEALAAGCSLWWLVSPIAGDGDACATRIGFKFAAVGLAAVAILAARFWQRQEAP